MGKAYLLVIFLLAASFSGCLDSSDNSDDSEETDSGNKPIATIVSITPNPVNITTLEKNGVAFVGLGNAGNGYIREYDWGSSIDGFLSSEKEFTTKSLSEGNHIIFFKVLNDENVWSDKATATLQVLNQTEDPDEETRTYENIEVWSVEGDFAPDPDQDQGAVMEAIENLTENPLQFQQVAHNNLSWKSYEHQFVIESEWEARFAMLLLTVDYHINGTEPSEGPAGTLNFSIKDPNGGEHAEGYEMVTWNNGISERAYLLPSIPGTWTITISGSGLEGLGSIAYSGDYSIRVESERLKVLNQTEAVEYGVDAKLLTNNHNTEPGYDTDFVLIVENTGSITDTFDIGVKRNDGGFTITIEEGYESVTIDKNMRKPVLINVKTSASSSGLLNSTIEVKSRGDGSQSIDVRLDVNTDYAFGNQTSIGDAVQVHYAGILARNADLFDSSMEYVWDNYDYFGEGVTDSNRHTNPLAASNIGCDSSDSHENCDGSRGMIPGFDAAMVGMYEGQTLAVRIPAKDAYGESGTSALAGEDLIFAIVMVSVE